MITEPRFHTEFGISLIHKLAAEGRAAGVQLFKDMKGRWFATSRRNPEQLHALTGFSCDCLQFQCHQSCPHHALLLVELNWLAPEPAPDPQPAVLCDQCGEPMRYLAGVSFECQCGHAWSAEWEPIDRIEMVVCSADPELVEDAAGLLVADYRTIGPDPDQEACRDDAPGMLNLSAYSANELAACLLWQHDRRDVADRMAA